MGRVATCECYKCHHIVPKTQAHQKSIRVHSGDSFGGTFNPNRSNSARIGGRSYFRKKNVWICNKCSIKSGINWIGWIGVAIIVYVMFG